MNNDSLYYLDFSVAAVVVTYNPVLEKISQLIARLKLQCNHIYIIDNNSQNVSLLIDSFDKEDKVTLIRNADNLGIGAAQNQGIKAAIDNNFVFTLLFDQDSLPDDDFVKNLVAGFRDVEKINKVAVVGPMLIDKRYDFFYSYIKLDHLGRRRKITPQSVHDRPFEISCLIASGMLIKNDCLSKIGFMNEDLFIDYVDTEWCLRCSLHGYSLYVIPKASLEHEIGDSNISLMGFRIPVHSPLRRYYRVRNGFWLLRMRHVPKLLAFREIIFSLIHQIIVFVRLKDLNYVKMYFKSLGDAFKKL